MSIELTIPNIGESITEVEIDAAAKMAQAAARPISDMRGSAEQRKHLAFVLTKRAIERAVERARG
jgi:carbon-monoxide dehydrogenase medium subunit